MIVTAKSGDAYLTWEIIKVIPHRKGDLMLCRALFFDWAPRLLKVSATTRIFGPEEAAELLVRDAHWRGRTGLPPTGRKASDTGRKA